jgi:hypothetical protein
VYKIETVMDELNIHELLMEYISRNLKSFIFEYSNIINFPYGLSIFNIFNISNVISYIVLRIGKVLFDLMIPTYFVRSRYFDKM